MKKILLVEDDVIIQTLFTEGLKLFGHEVHVYDEQRSVSEVIDKFQPDIVFSDVMMISGGHVIAYELFRNYYDLPLVMISSSQEHLDQFTEFSNVVDCMHKPFNIEDINNVIKKYT